MQNERRILLAASGVAVAMIARTLEIWSLHTITASRWHSGQELFHNMRCHASSMASKSMHATCKVKTTTIHSWNCKLLGEYRQKAEE